MSTIAKVLFLVFTLLLIPWSLAVSDKPPVTPDIDEPTPADFTLQLEPNKTTYALFEPVYLTVTLRNPTVWPVIAEFRSLSLVDQNLKLYVQEGAGPSTPYYSGVVACSVGTARKDFPPDATIVSTLSVLFNDRTNTLAFPNIGQHTIRGEIYLGRHPDAIFVESATAQIEVVAPGVADQQLIDELGSEKHLDTLLRKGPYRYCEEQISEDITNLDCIETVRSIVTRFQNSVYAPAIASQVASFAAWDGAGNDRNYHLQAQLFQEFLSRWPNHPLAPRATSMVAIAFHKSGMNKEAMEWLSRFESKYPELESPRKRIAQPG